MVGKSRNEHAVVVGASIAGLLAGRVLSDFFDRVTLLDKEPLDCGTNTRKAVPQGNHVHAILPPAYHVLNECQLPKNQREFCVVDFRRVYSLPISFVRTRAARAPHLRLLPPYREHLSQAFARYFMRVGLPADIPKFKE